ncbi:MAG TPA: Zn-ribbon domain-containing OB-fold protein [Stellaceae bacterium]|nr:Zn-ribbon domain-containing OB-fold protein [Stellaceae bacterium]
MSESSARKPRPLPVPTRTTEFFWDAAKAGKLALQYDPVAKRYQFWPRAISVATGQQNLEWRIVSGLGRIYSFTVTHVPTQGFEDRGPYPVALVELDEGVRIIANLVNVDPAAVTIGMRVKVAFEKLAPDINYFAFEPA